LYHLHFFCPCSNVVRDEVSALAGLYSESLLLLYFPLFTRMQAPSLSLSLSLFENKQPLSVILLRKNDVGKEDDSIAVTNRPDGLEPSETLGTDEMGRTIATKESVEVLPDGRIVTKRRTRGSCSSLQHLR
jgi:hypothetical protein